MKRVMDYLYKHWAMMCLPLAFYTGLILISSVHQLPWIVFLIWLQFPVYLLHQFEEHAWPGGFKKFTNKVIFGVENTDVPLNDINIFWINIPIIWIFFPLFAVLAQHIDLSIGSILPVLGLFNATLHILTTIIKRKYNPGTIVSLFLNYPTGIYTLWEMHRAHLLTPITWVYAVGFAFIAHLFIAVYARHRYQTYKRQLEPKF